MDEIPVTVLSGALGAGKTTTLNHLLESAGGREIAVLVNDMGEVNVDARLIENREDGVAELSNGCICCDLRDDLEIEMGRLAREREFETLVVESSGISEPAPVARLFTTGAASAPYELDTLATVVNAETFRDTVRSGETAAVEDVRRTRTGRADRETERRPLSELLVGQVECANVVLLNKCDLVDEPTLAATETLLESLNPEARIVRTTEGAVAPDEILATGLFDLDTTSETAAWQRAADHADRDHDHSPQSAYGIDSFVIRADRPVDGAAFESFVESLPESVVRSKGQVWIAGDDETRYRFNQAGPSARLAPGEQWVAAMSETRQEMQRRMHPDLPWGEHGDRRSELVVIGREMDEASIRRSFETGLVDVGETVSSRFAADATYEF